MDKITLNSNSTALMSSEFTTITTKIGSDTYSIRVKKYLNASDMDSLHRRVLASVYDEDDEFKPQFYQYILRRCVIEAYTDIDLPEDTDEAYLCCYSLLWDSVLDNIDYNQYSDIVSAIDKHIVNKENRVCAMIHFKEVMNSLQTITQAMLNFDNLPTWLSDNLDNGEYPLLKKE